MVINWDKFKIFASDDGWLKACDILNGNIKELEGMLSTLIKILVLLKFLPN